MAAEKKMGDFGLKKGDKVPLGVAIKMAQMSPANRLGATSVGSAGGQGRALSPKLIAERTREEMDRRVNEAVAAALAEREKKEKESTEPELFEDEKEKEAEEGVTDESKEE